MDKGHGHINEFKGNSTLSMAESRTTKAKVESALPTVSESALSHSSVGEFNTNDRPKSGGHGQESIDYMDAHGIPYEINEEYNNGVRTGNLPTHTQKMFHSGNRHTWFPKSWTSQDIKAAGEYVASQHPGPKTPRVHYSAEYKGVKVTVVFGEHGEIKTIFPAADQPGGKKK